LTTAVALPVLAAGSSASASLSCASNTWYCAEYFIYNPITKKYQPQLMCCPSSPPSSKAYSCCGGVDCGDSTI